MRFTKTARSIVLLFICFSFYLSNCSEPQNKNSDSSTLQILNSQGDTTQPRITMKDARDGEVYAIITIGKQTWMAENLRYNAPGSLFNPSYPSINYGRLYDGFAALTICPDGWHLPSDEEWIELEMSLGLSAEEAYKTGWRGTHGTHMKSVEGWENGLAGTNNSRFNALPAGFYFSGGSPDDHGFDGLGSSVGYWTSTISDKSWVRFIGAPLEGVNRFNDDRTIGALACRCVKD